MCELNHNINESEFDLQNKSIRYKEKELRNRLDMLTFVLNRSDEIILIVDENTNIIFANEKASEALGYSQDELLSLHIANVAPNFKEEVLLQFPLVGLPSHGSSIMEMVYKTKDKRSFQVEVKISPYMSSQCYFSLVAKDITVNTQLFDLLIHNEKEFVAFIENSNDIIIRYDLAYRCIYVNETFEKITGYSRLSIVEKYIWETGILSENQIQLLKPRLSMVIQSGMPVTFDFVLYHAITNLPVHLEVHIQPEYDSDEKITGLTIIAHDISTLKYKEKELVIAKERAEESSRMKSFFLAIISHEIRTPLNAIIGLSQLIKDETLSFDERDEFIDLIEKSGMKLIHNVEDVLELSKIASGQLKINCENYYPNVIIKEKYLQIIKMLGVNQKDLIEVKIEYLDSCNVNVPPFSDINLIKQVLNILMSNAVKFTNLGQIVLGVSIAENEKIIFYVSDTGIGIPKEKHESIFEPFVQVDITMMRPYEGLGIGLTLARRIARALGGDLTVDSIPGKGSTFFFSLPLSQKSD